MSEPVTVRRWQPGDLPRLEALLEEAFSPPVAARARWKYLENPVQPDPLIAVAEVPGGRLVGCYPFVGRRFRLADGSRLAVIGTDVAVLPGYRAGGLLYPRLGILAGELAREAGASFVYGFPNEQALRVAKRLLAARDWARLEAWLLPVRSTWTALLARGWSRLTPNGWARPTGPPSGLRAAEGEGERDARFLRWRFGDARRYRFRAGAPGSDAYLALATAGRLGREALVVDFGPAAAEGALEALLRAEIAEGGARGVERLWVWCLPASPMAAVVGRLGFRRAPERDKPVTAGALLEEPPPPPSHLTIADADDP